MTKAKCNIMAAQKLKDDIIIIIITEIINQSLGYSPGKVQEEEEGGGRLIFEEKRGRGGRRRWRWRRRKLPSRLFVMLKIM